MGGIALQRCVKEFDAIVYGTIVTIVAMIPDQSQTAHQGALREIG